jgi:hypothetical protein
MALTTSVVASTPRAGTARLESHVGTWTVPVSSCWAISGMWATRAAT